MIAIIFTIITIVICLAHLGLLIYIDCRKESPKKNAPQKPNEPTVTAPTAKNAPK